MTFVLMNRCEATVGVTVAGRVKTSTSYLASDKGGWAGASTGEQRALVCATNRASKRVLRAAGALPPVSLTLVDVVPMARLKREGSPPTSTM